MRAGARLSRLGPLLLGLWGATGCPVLLEDDFRKMPGSSNEQNLEGDGSTDPDGAGGTTNPDGGMDGASMADGALPCLGCSFAEACCDGVCVDLTNDPQNCRECGTGCPGTICSNATCTNLCAFGFIDCNRNVIDGCEVNAATDPQNCGNCGIACAFEQQCVQGFCVCPEGTADCDGNLANACETDTGSDRSNCGACGRVCGTSETCAGGACLCLPGFADCNGIHDDGCEASLGSSSTCGACTVSCGVTGVCTSQGACECAAGFLDCDGAVPGCETPANDPGHCGSCSIVCAAPTPACDGVQCVASCGSLALCGGSCADTSTDARNCGRCGNAVGLHQVCVDGRAQCEAGFADCDSSSSDCEVDTRTDGSHCGGCGVACKPGAVCGGGVCGCAPDTPRDCGVDCRKCCSNTDCSDGNSCTADTCSNGTCQFSAPCASGGLCCAGNGCFECCGNGDCPSGKVCSDNACATLTCAAPLIPCGSRCADVTTDPENCNGCGSACGPGRTCAASSCTPKWLAMAPPPAGLVAREKAAYAAFGSKAFVWGGVDDSGTHLSTGGVYDTATDGWTELPVDAQTPSARILASAVWTGTYMVVWGGGDASGTVDHSSGARFDPATSAWSPMSAAPIARRAPYGFWTGSRVLFWGGFDRSGMPAQGAYLYDPANDVWTAAHTKDQPPALLHPTVGWSGTLLLTYGGRPGGSSATQNTYSYSPSSDSWRRVHDGMSARYGSLGTWDGSSLVAWSGSLLRNEGKRYLPGSDSWVSLTTTNAPTARYAAHRATGWSARVSTAVTLVVGGYGVSVTEPIPLTDGALFNATTNTWTAVSPWPSGKAHLWGVGVLAGSVFIVWGGRDSTGALTTLGDRFRP